LGDGIKKPSESEKKNICVARKSIVAKRYIQKGEIFTEENLTVKGRVTASARCNGLKFLEEEP